MIIQTFDTRPLIENNENSVITFAARKRSINVYDFDFKSFGDLNAGLEIESPEKNKFEPLEDKLSTYDEDEELHVLISLMRKPARAQRRKSCSFALNSPFEFEFLNSKRDLDDFHSLTDYEFSGEQKCPINCASEGQKTKRQQLLDDSIDEAIIAKNGSMISFDDDVVETGYFMSNKRDKRTVCQSKKVKMSLDC